MVDKMQNFQFRRIIILGIALLFIGLSITSGISKNIGEIKNQTPKQLPINYLINHSYVNGYWKFNEGSGNILEDSSGHDFDGTIYGAEWINGYSGYALDFYGIDDYVSLDDYSEELGFNKTDDVIFSLWFNSTSNKYSFIYSMSDAFGILKAEVDIGLDSNGKIIILFFFSDCVISITSENTYNDGAWHNIKVFYHGTKSSPTVDLYIDDELDSSVKGWLCSFSADEFKKIKIGRRAPISSEHFDGEVDELKIIRYIGGNQPPNKPIITGPTLGLLGEKLNYSIITTDEEEDDIEYQIDWGDGDITDWFGPFLSGEGINLSHEYSKNGTYAIKTRAKDFWHVGDWSDSFIVGIGNQAPETPEQPSGPTKGSMSIEYTYSSSAIDVDNDTLWYQFDWGDGNFSDLVGPYGSGDIAEASHTWNEIGNYEVRVKATDLINASSWSQPLNITIKESSLKIEVLKSSFFKIKAIINNIGDEEVKNVNWSVDIIGGFILRGGNSTGEISSIPIGEDITIKSVMIIGLGPTTIKVSVKAPDGSHEIYERDAFILLFLIKINSND